MVFKGFTDENGNVIPVQGAGTVYNEEKNSIAIGKDTIASGQDQFVFGRKNVADEEKAEIVGGGFDKDVYYNLTSYAATDSEDNMLHVTTQKYKFLGYYEGDASDEQEVLDFVHFDEWKHLMAESSREEFIPVIKRFITSNNQGDGNDGGRYVFLAEDYEKFIGEDKDGYLLIFMGQRDPYGNNGWKIGYWELNQGDEDYMWLSTQSHITNRVGVPETSANIRTLDWQGNQWNAGDITCDDGNGNTISMRDLLSRIATLEAAANS